MKLFCFVGSIKGSANFTFMTKGRRVSKVEEPLVYTDLQRWRAVRACKSCFAWATKFCVMTFIFLLNKEHHCFGTELEKSEADPRWRYDFRRKSQKSGIDFKWRLFVLENTMVLGQKVRNLRMIAIEDFFLENTMILRQIWSSSENPRQYFVLTVKYCMPTACPASEGIARHWLTVSPTLLHLSFCCASIKHKLWQ